jgi:hypothetical protein
MILPQTIRMYLVFSTLQCGLPRLITKLSRRRDLELVLALIFERQLDLRSIGFDFSILQL